MTDWRRGGVIYQIYPRSFSDSNGDGVGDLPGIAARLDYVASLGVDGIWLSPFFRSPMRDFGYDVSDYCDVDPLFGTLADFDALLFGAHARGLKLVIDQVYSHTSDRHPWFEESRARAGGKADWYVWADAKADGTPPNKWLSLFGGPAWTWDMRRHQYYLHNFLAEQPDLDFNNPEVRAAILDVARFWLDRGVDGFRLDVVNFYACDARLRDNPAKGGRFARPYLHQRHLYDRSQPETLAFIEELRRLLDRYPERFAVGEIVSDEPLKRSADYAAPGRLHTAYNFLFLESARLSPSLIRSAFEGSPDDFWPSWSLSNHDVVRAATRFGGANPDPAHTRLLLGLLFALRGTIFLYQGEELGLPQADVPFDRLQDPEGLRFYPLSLGRDGARTPMPWRQNDGHAGFSSVEPWLPVDASHRALAVDVQERDRRSALNATRRFIAFRKERPAVTAGAIEFVDAPEPLVAFRRTHGAERLLCIFNLGPQPAKMAVKQGLQALDYGLPGALVGKTAELPAFGGLIIEEG